MDCISKNYKEVLAKLLVDDKATKELILAMLDMMPPCPVHPEILEPKYIDYPTTVLGPFNIEKGNRVFEEQRQKVKGTEWEVVLRKRKKLEEP